MNLRQQIIQDRVENTARILDVSEDIAFLRFTHSLITERSLYSFVQADFVEGGQDKQIDVITIDQEESQATVYILQFKNTTSFSSNSVIQIRNGLNWIFNKKRADVSRLDNVKFKDKILEYRSVQSDLGPSNITVIVGFVTNGLSGGVSPEFLQEVKTIVDQYDNDTFESFEFQVWGADELVNRINMIEKRERRVDADLRIRYDANNPSLIRYHSGGLKGLVCSVSAQEIARVVNDDPTGAIFDSNIRRFRGRKGSVNKDIMRTCTTLDIGHLFWFLNNGITVVCDSFDAVTDPDNPHVKITNMQIVNGCQTATSLALAAEEDKLSRDVRVIMRIYETEDDSLVNNIVLTTNNQNRITNRDLRANDPVQIDMERGFAKHDFLFERKSYQFDKEENIDISRIVVNETVAQSYLAIVLKKPSDASRRKYKVWGEYFERIFGGHSMIEPYVLSNLVYNLTSNWLRDNYANDSDDIRRKLANNGAFHVARIVAYLWKGNDNWAEKVEQQQKYIAMIEKSPAKLDTHLADAFKIFMSIIKKNEKFLTDIDVALKSATLDSDIDRELYSAHKRS